MGGGLGWVLGFGAVGGDGMNCCYVLSVSGKALHKKGDACN